MASQGNSSGTFPFMRVSEPHSPTPHSVAIRVAVRQGKGRSYRKQSTEIKDGVVTLAVILKSWLPMLSKMRTSVGPPIERQEYFAKADVMRIESNEKTPEGSPLESGKRYVASAKRTPLVSVLKNEREKSERSFGTGAGVVAEKDGLESYVWSSLPHYLGPARKRPSWLETAMGFDVCGCDDTASGRREFLRLLERRVDWRNPRRAGTTFPEGDGQPQLAVYSSLRRGWLFGSEHFREKLLRRLAKRPTRMEKANGYHGPQLNDYAEKRARALIRAALEHFGSIWQPCEGLAREIGAKG